MPLLLAWTQTERGGGLVVWQQDLFHRRQIVLEPQAPAGQRIAVGIGHGERIAREKPRYVRVKDVVMRDRVRTRRCFGDAREKLLQSDADMRLDLVEYPVRAAQGEGAVGAHHNHPCPSETN